MKLFSKRFKKQKEAVYSGDHFVPALDSPGAYYKLESNSTTWEFIRRWASKELIKARLKNDSSGLDEISTAALRGRIGCLKDLLALPEEPDKKGLLASKADEGQQFGGSEYGE